MHHELPERLDLEWYRKQAKDLVRAFRAGDRTATERVREGLGDRERFRLSDAQHLIATDHGFATWADFKRWVGSRAPQPPVGRIGRQPVSFYEERARALVDDVREGNGDARRRVRAHVPRLAAFAGGDLAMRDAKLVVAREYGFPTWRELVFHVEKAITEHEGQREGDADVVAALDAIRRADVDALRELLDRRPELIGPVHRGAWTTLLQAIAQPDVVGDRLGTELGVDPAVVELLIERGSELNEPLGLAACFNRAALVRMLLDAGAQPHASEIWGITPLQTAIYHGAREAGDLLAAAGLAPDAFYVAAGAGRLDALETWFDERGSLRPEALALRPNLADVGWPPAPPPRDDPQEALDEAFALAAYNGRIEAMARLLETGASVDGAAHLGLTALHFAVIARRLDVARWLVERGADVTVRDRIHDDNPLGLAEHTARGSDVHRFLEAL
jgi:ankyrin repeat protein